MMATIGQVMDALKEAQDTWKDENAWAPLTFELKQRGTTFILHVRPRSVEWEAFDYTLDERDPIADAHYVALLFLRDYAELIPQPTDAGRTVTQDDIFGGRNHA